MSRNRHPNEDGTDIVELKLPVPERTAILVSQAIEKSLLGRLQATPMNQPIAFEIEELEDLHRSLAFDAAHADDKKRQKLLKKVLGKIETHLEQADSAPEQDSRPFSFRFDEAIGEALTPVGPLPRAPKPRLPPVCEVRLTKKQRETLRAMDTISGDIHKLLDIDSTREEAMAFNPRQLMVASLALHEAFEQSASPAGLAPLAELMERFGSAVMSAMSEIGDGTAPNPRTDVNYQLKITLERSKPPIWRRVIAPDCPLDLLHEIIQGAMGWDNGHLHMFEWGDEQFSDPEFELDENDYDESSVNLSQLVENGCEKLRYWYDFGDDWWHTIKIEKTLEPKPSEQTPRCTKAVGACPPEDCGGLWGYYDLLEAVRDKKHERHEELMEWLGEDYDPNHVDLAEINEDLGKLAAAL